MRNYQEEFDKRVAWIRNLVESRRTDVGGPFAESGDDCQCQ